ncbi:MAG: hypothetical protein K2J06_04900 [Muribaculaceae bacterium]|nr:hypothetical protein [Muribaculaceae bacterium]
MVQTIILAILLIAVAVTLLGVKVFFVKGGQFPSGHAHDIPELRKRGIRCAHSDDSDRHDSAE